MALAGALTAGGQGVGAPRVGQGPVQLHGGRGAQPACPRRTRVPRNWRERVLSPSALLGTEALRAGAACPVSKCPWPAGSRASIRGRPVSHRAPPCGQLQRFPRTSRDHSLPWDRGDRLPTAPRPTEPRPRAWVLLGEGGSRWSPQPVSNFS